MLFEIPRGCNICSLKAEWPKLCHPIIPVEHYNSEGKIVILVVGEAPGEEEDKQNRPFVGVSGLLLRKYLPTIDFLKANDINLVFTNIVKCRPPDNRTPTDDEVRNCTSYLEEQIKFYRPHAILAVGSVALSYFINRSQISNYCNIIMPLQITKDFTCHFMGIVHPSYVLRSSKMAGGDEQNPALTCFINGLKKFMDNAASFASRPIIPTPPCVICPKSIDEARSVFARLNRAYFSVDLETIKKKPYLQDAKLLTCALSDGNTTMAWPVEWPSTMTRVGGWGFNFFKEVFEGYTAWAAFSGSFELAWIIYLTGLVHDCDDPRLMSRLLLAKKHIYSLEDQTMIWLGRDIKKETEVDSLHLLEYPLETVLKYNGLDAWASQKLTDLLVPKIVVSKYHLDNYVRMKEIQHCSALMELKGLNVDLESTKKLSETFSAMQEEAEAAALDLPEVKRFQEVTRTVFSFSSKDALTDVLINEYGVSLPKTEADNFCVDEQVLEKLSDTVPLANLALDYREYQKLNSTYLNPIIKGIILGVDKRVHPCYKVLGTVTGRLSSEDPNFQNWPKRKHREIRQQIIADEGTVLASFDYGQLEARVIAMASRDPVLIDSIIRKVDIHIKWLDRILELYPDYVLRLREKTGETDEAKVRKSGRDTIKTDFVFASFYGSEEDAIVARTGIPKKLAKSVLDEFWSEYKAVKAWAKDRQKKYLETGILSTLTGYQREEIVFGNEPTNNESQGTAAHIVLAAQAALFAMSLKDRYLLPRINVHDDLTFMLPDNDLLKGYLNLIGDVMVKPRFDFINVPLMVEGKIGYNWAEMEVVGKWEGEYYA